MHPTRHPIREIRDQYLDNTDRFAEYHEQRLDPEHDVRTEANFPLAVIHIAPKLAFSKAATRFPVPELLDRDIRLHSGSSRPRHPEMKANGIACSSDPAPQRGQGGSEVRLYENGVLELTTARVSYERGERHLISDSSLTDPIAWNLSIVLSLLAEQRQDQKVLVTATFIGFDGTRFNAHRPTSPVTDDYVQAPVLSFSAHDASENGTSYNLRTEYVKELFRPLIHSAGREDVPMDIPETLDLPDLSLDE
ncbi:hypothetical protein [Halorubrum laminariae]|uniref:Uncharacterized protein n=1 Tax=Halorubrum laminariae TaxID=1433523 RepID=A0ABD6C5M4_9EURY|nr:hypothetical protein [Halorubrum laminariae]